MSTPLDDVDAHCPASPVPPPWHPPTPSWPKRVTMLAVVRDAQAWEVGETLGLTGEALRFFGQEDSVAIEYAVYADGRRVRLTCEGVALPEEEAPRDK